LLIVGGAKHSNTSWRRQANLNWEISDLNSLVMDLAKWGVKARLGTGLGLRLQQKANWQQSVDFTQQSLSALCP